MRPEEYLNTVTEQIRCQKAREQVSGELGEHIMDQAAAYEADGMFREEALERAVRDMGDPVETGVALDRVHRPKMSIELLILIGIISLCSIAVHAALMACNSEDIISGTAYFRKHIIYTLAGYFLMLLVYRLDYSIFARWGRQIAGGFLAVVIIWQHFFGLTVNGATWWVRLGPVTLSVPMLLYLFVPFYGGVLYACRGKGYKGIGESLLWAFIPAYCVFRIAALSTALIILGSSLVLLSVAVWKGWYQVNQKKTLAVLWAGMLMLPVICFGGLYATGNLAGYQAARLRAFFGQDSEYNYQQLTAKTFLDSSHFIGGNADNVAGLAERLPDFNSDYVFISLVSAYGILAGALVCALLALLVVKIFRISFRQKNQLGMILGCGCGIVLLLQTLMNLTVNLNLFPNTSVTLPFFSAGGSGLMVSYILLGIVMSVYRYKDILTEKLASGKVESVVSQEF